MNKKAIIFKALKYLFFLAGFPLMMMVMIIIMAPMFGTEVLGNHAQNWVIGFTVMGVILLIIHFLLEKFIGAKGRTHRKLVLVVMSALSVLCIMLPSAIYDAAMRPKYEAARNKLVGEVDVKDFNAVQGWHRDFTKRYDSDVYVLINENYDFIKLYGLEHTYSEWYDNADKENNLGYKYGSFEKAEKLVKNKLEAKANLEKAQAELNAIEAEIEAKKLESDKAQEALAAEPDNTELKAAAETALAAYNKLVADKEADLVRLKGLRVDISAYKSRLISVVVDAVNNIDTVLPDGLTLNIFGTELNLYKYVMQILNMAGSVGFEITPELVEGLIPDIIYTGIGNETVSTYQAIVDGSDSDVSLAEAQKLDFKFKYYPSVLAAGAMKYVCYIFVGIVVFCIFASDYFNQKEKEEVKKND